MYPVLMGLARYIPRALSGARNIVAQQGGYGVARNFVMPAIAGEIAGKGVNYATGIPEEYVDAAMMAFPASNVAKGVSAMSKPIALYKPTGKSLLKLATDRGVDAIFPNAANSTGFTPQDAMQGFYRLINPNVVAAANDQQNYAGLQEWFYGSKIPLNQLPNPQKMMSNSPQTFVNNAYDPRDLTNQYNTELTPLEQDGYNKWIRTLHPNYRNTYDYDLQGYYKAALNKQYGATLTQDANGRAHLVDAFKKPNHKTFSKYSIYNGKNGFTGGDWIQLRNGKNWKFIADPSNMWTPEELQNYFRINEPNNILAFKQR